MPVIIDKKLPAKKTLENENIFVMSASRANDQDIRPLQIAVLNLMPNKEDTELQLLRLIGNSPLQVEVSFLCTSSYVATHTSQDHICTFYTTLSKIKEGGKKFDGLIITGAPIEKLDFTEVKYWEEFKEVLDWAEHNVYSTFYICWAAQAAMYYFYGAEKVEMPKKKSGIFLHKTENKHHPLVRNFDDYFFAPHSRHTEIKKSEFDKIDDVEILAESDEAGVFIAISKSGRRVMVFGHAEYDKYTLDGEYKRDLKAGLSDVEEPMNYYDDNGKPLLTWRGHSALLFSNWLNYFVYQATPFDVNEIE